MVVKIEMFFRIEDEKYEKIKKMEHHADWFLNLDEYPEIKSVFGVKVKEEKTWRNSIRRMLQRSLC